MKQLLFLALRLKPCVVLASLLLTGCLSDGGRSLPAEDTLVWCGLDYSMVKMIGRSDFNQPERIFPGMIVEWNTMFLREVPELVDLAKAVKIDTTAVAARNEKTGPQQIERVDGSRDEFVKPTHITERDISEVVRSYQLSNATGLGLVFLMDRLVKEQETACLYVVFFDVSSRKILHSERMCNDTTGGSFRGHWYRPIKLAVENLSKPYKKAVLAKHSRR